MSLTEYVMEKRALNTLTAWAWDIFCSAALDRGATALVAAAATDANEGAARPADGAFVGVEGGEGQEGLPAVRGFAALPRGRQCKDGFPTTAQPGAEEMEEAGDGGDGGGVSGTGGGKVTFTLEAIFWRRACTTEGWSGLVARGRVVAGGGTKTGCGSGGRGNSRA